MRRTRISAYGILGIGGAVLLCSAGVARAESAISIDAGPPSCVCDDDCTAYGLAVCHRGECFATGFAGAGTPCPPCKAPLQECAGGCVDFTSSPDHCGACDNACKEQGWIPFECVAGKCTCSETECNGSCVPVARDPDNCGRCGNKCGERMSCIDGSCICETRSMNRALCGGRCVDPLSDAEHCGVCGNACAAGQICVSGTCADPSPRNPEEAGGCAVVAPPVGMWLPVLLLLAMRPWRPR